MRVRGGPDVVPVQDVLAQRGIPVRGRRGQGQVREAGRGRVRERVERRLAVARVARPPAHGDLLRIHGVAHDEVARRRIGGQPGEQAHRQVEGPPPRVDRRGPPAVGRPVRRQDQRGLGRRGEIVSDLAGVVVRVLVVLVQRHLPRHLLRGRVDLHRAAQRAHRRQHIPGDRADRAVRGERDAFGPAVTVLDPGFVEPQVKDDDQGSRTIRGGQRQGLPSARRQAQRRVLKLRLRRGQLRRQLAQDLGVGVQRVTRRVPLLIGQHGPGRRHERQATVRAWSAWRTAT